MAPHAFSLTDGTTTINLNLAAGNMIQSYAMDTAEDINDPQITESMEILFVASSGPNLQTAINAAERLLVAARFRQDRPNAFPRVYLQVQIDGEANTWRAEIVEGRLKPGEDVLRLWPNFKAAYTLLLTHRAWEGPRKELSISSSGNSAGTGGKPITNNANNWIQIASSQVGGVLPAPLELQLTNNGGSSVGYRNFYIGCNAFSTASLTHNYSGGSASLTLLSGVYTGQVVIALSAAQMQLTDGRAFKIFGRFTAQSASMYCKAILRDVNNLMTLGESDEIYMPLASAGTQWIDLGTIPLPPGGYSTTWTDANLVFVFRAAASASVTLNVARVMATDSYQYIVQRGFLITAGGAITFDNIEGLYHAGGQSIYSVRSEKPLMVFPGATQRVNIMFDEGGSSDTAKTLSVQAFIRERRLTV